MDETRKLLVETRVKDLGALTSSNLVQLLDTSTVGQALQVLAENRILSAPVIAPGDDGVAEGVVWPAQLPNSDIMGFVCVNDILTSFLECYSREFGGVDYVNNRVNGHHANGRSVTANGHHAAAAAAAANAGCATPAAAAAAAAATSSSGGGGCMLARMRMLEAMGQRFAEQQLRHLSCKGIDGDFLHSRHAGEATLLELAMYGFLDPKRRGMHEGEQQSRVVHRVALFDSSGRITAIISQSDICRFLAARLHVLGPLGAATVAELGWGSKQVVSCTPETPALEAMRMMVEEGVSSLAVVAASGSGSGTGLAPEPASASAASPAAAPAMLGCRPAAGGGGGGGGGRLLGNFSASEMRTMTAEHFGALALPVGEFLALENETEYVAVNRERLLSEEGLLGSPAHDFVRERVRRVRPHSPGEEVGQRLVVATRDNTFAEVVGLLVRHRIHRVYIVDEREVPVGIVTCTDILRKQQQPQHRQQEREQQRMDWDIR
ncbi:hypothetical protein VOLCADRAFT_107937 [Volvox carteri f. nagariensis]|uniref:CBS domain-containing protein n=1 Tax=Volvox carteri f. nagariensis TaxID=3068 RepID=D8UHB1_VOLCA|nr:uncharacterized protein VOLCADRAFT_107937 [Volvox carteri f. nagariensis]EFJ40899.1 hypothetical protein VOLCADRAFT_107937 [Volvox carteri f. nagariensis]|eukprot:XP_002958059.1 hypothetical protein VOLCADRAFT_107937 [Volvox carteri f. nagariensis]